MRLLRLADAESALQRFEALSPERRGLFSSERLVYACGDSVFVALPCRDPLLETSDLFIPLFDSALLRAEYRDAWLGEIVAQWSADRVILRAAPDLDATLLSGWQPLACYVSKPAQYRPMEPTVTIEPVDAASAAFVHDLLKRALRNGYGAKSLNDSALDRYVAEQFVFDDCGATRALVARLGGDMVGHITWQDDVVDDLSGTEVIELIDVYVLEQYEGMRISQQLTAALEQRLAPSRAIMRGNVLPNPCSGDAGLINALSSAGWREEFRLWSCAPVAPPPRE